MRVTWKKSYLCLGMGKARNKLMEQDRQEDICAYSQTLNPAGQESRAEWTGQPRTCKRHYNLDCLKI